MGLYAVVFLAIPCKWSLAPKRKRKRKKKETNSAMQGHVGLQCSYAKLEMGLVYGDCKYFFKSK